MDAIGMRESLEEDGERQGRSGTQAHCKGARLTIASLPSLTRQGSAPSTKGAPGGAKARA